MRNCFQCSFPSKLSAAIADGGYPCSCSRLRRHPGHWGDCTDSDDSSCPTQTWCPFNWYRSSGDINAGATSWLRNLQSTIRFQDYESPLSVPGIGQLLQQKGTVDWSMSTANLTRVLIRLLGVPGHVSWPVMSGGWLGLTAACVCHGYQARGGSGGGSRTNDIPLGNEPPLFECC